MSPRRTSLRTTLTALALVLALGVAGTSAGCYGKFGLTRKIYTWNGTATGNKFANSAIMLGLMIIPVYEVGSLIDLIILNPIEVFTGQNPMSQNDGATRTRENGHDWVLTPIGPNTVEVRRDGVLAFRYTVEHDRVVVEPVEG